MKKVLSVLLILALVFGLAACGGGETAEEPAGDEAMKVGFIYIGTKNDGGFTQAHHEGTMAMEEYFGGKVTTIIKEGVDDTDKQAVKEAALGMIDQGATVIVGCSFGFMDGLDELANDPAYEGINFLHFSGYKMNDTNFGNYFGATEEPRYLSGIVAGMQTETNKLGYVAAFPYTEVQIGINAFTLGAQSVNPDVEVKVVYINSWYDPAQEKAAAEALLAQGCDVIAQHCDTTGPQVAAAEKGVYAIGYNMDNSAVVPESFLTAPIWHHEKFLIPTIEAIMDGTWTPESYYGTMADGYVDLLPLTENAPEGAAEKVAEIEAQIKAGDFNVFAGPVKNQAGEVVIADGEQPDRAKIWAMDYLVQGVIGTVE